MDTKYVCKTCNICFTHNSEYKRHQKLKNSCIKINEYKCEKCDYTTVDKTRYTKHLNRKTSCSKENINKVSDLEEKIDGMKNKMEILEKKLKEKQKGPKVINYNFIVNNYVNACNIEDCMNIGKITPELIEQCKNMSLKNGSTYILDGFCNMDKEMRPIHCTDASRMNYIVRSENAWRKDPGGEQIKNNLSPLVEGVYKKVHIEKIRDEEIVDDIEERLRRNEKMSTELNCKYIDKSCLNAIKKSSANYLVKNMEMLMEEGGEVGV